MSARASYFKIGLFVISAATIAVIGLVVLGAGVLFQKTIPIETYFEQSIQGLDVGSPVKFRGVQIGKVEAINLASRVYPTARQYVLVRMGLFPEAAPVKIEKHMDTGSVEIAREIQRETERGLRIRLAFQGLTGTAYLEADYLDPNLYPPLEIDWEPHYPYCASAPSMMTRVGEAVDKIMRDMERIDVPEIVGELNRSLSALTRVVQDANVKHMSEETVRLLSEVRETNERIGNILEAREVTSLLGDASAAMAALRRTAEGAERPIGEVLSNLPELSESLVRVVGKLEATSDDLTEALVRLRRVSYGLDDLVIGQQPDVERTVENMRVVSENLRELSETIKRDPSRLLFGKPTSPPPRVRSR